MALESLQVLQNLEKTLREEFEQRMSQLDGMADDRVEDGGSRS